MTNEMKDLTQELDACLRAARSDLAGERFYMLESLMKLASSKAAELRCMAQAEHAAMYSIPNSADLAAADEDAKARAALAESGALTA